jgi:hypothetical protein
MHEQYEVSESVQIQGWQHPAASSFKCVGQGQGQGQDHDRDKLSDNQ